MGTEGVCQADTHSNRQREDVTAQKAGHVDKNLEKFKSGQPSTKKEAQIYMTASSKLPKAVRFL